MIIAKGKLVASDTPENLENLMSGTGHVELEAKTSMEKAKAILKGIPLISKAEYREETKESVTVRIDRSDPWRYRWCPSELQRTAVPESWYRRRWLPWSV